MQAKQTYLATFPQLWIFQNDMSMKNFKQWHFHKPMEKNMLYAVNPAKWHFMMFWNVNFWEHCNVNVKLHNAQTLFHQTMNSIFTPHK